jgi:hypothetical protein
VITTLQKWLMGLLGLGALYLVLTNASNFAKATTGVRQLVGGTESDVISGGTK